LDLQNQQIQPLTGRRQVVQIELHQMQGDLWVDLAPRLLHRGYSLKGDIPQPDLGY
jgi:hypothetical protein